MPEKTKKPRSYGAVAIAEAVIILGLTAGLFLSFHENKADERTIPVNATLPEESGDGDPEERVRPVIEKEETFYQLSGEKILMHDSTYGEVFVPVFKDVPACSLNMDSIVTRNGYSFYKENGEITSIPGVDVSEHQGSINWEQVKAAGIEFAIIRIGYRTYGGGEIVLDKNFRENIENADKAGIKVGVYFFSQAITGDEAIEEADAVLNEIEDLNITYPVIFDWELIYDDNARTDAVTVEGLADICVMFCERVKAAGYTPMIYQNKNTALRKLDLPRLKDYDFWLAEYSDEPSYYYDYKIWQYSSDGYVPGISGRVDMNICFTDYSAE